MKSLTATQHACLEAMGIDVWLLRDHKASENMTTETFATEAITVEHSVTTNAEVKVVAENNKLIGQVINSISAVEQEPEQKLKQQPEIETQQPPARDLPQDWPGLIQVASTCQDCSLHTSRHQTVFGNGNQNADWLILADAPTTEDDKTGQPFSGEQGELLNAMLHAIGLRRQQVYLTTLVKCCPADNREADNTEYQNCRQYIEQQISMINPKLILVFGQNAAQKLLDNHSTLARLRNKVHYFGNKNIPVIVSYHPASLLRQPSNKRNAWHDLILASKTISSESVL